MRIPDVIALSDDGNDMQPTVGKRKKRRMIQRHLKDAEDVRAKAAAGSSLACVKDPIEQRIADLKRQLIDLKPLKLQVTQAQKAVETVAEEVNSAQERLATDLRKHETKEYELKVLLAKQDDMDEDIDRDEDSDLEDPASIPVRTDPHRTPYQSPAGARARVASQTTRVRKTRGRTLICRERRSEDHNKTAVRAHRTDEIHGWSHVHATFYTWNQCSPCWRARCLETFCKSAAEPDWCGVSWRWEQGRQRTRNWRFVGGSRGCHAAFSIKVRTPQAVLNASDGGHIVGNFANRNTEFTRTCCLRGR